MKLKEIPPKANCQCFHKKNSVTTEFVLRILKILLLLLMPVSVMSSCSDSKHDPRLVEIEDMVSYSPPEVLQRLDSIDGATLSEGDRLYLDFLTIKARDKAFVRHESDSLILEVIDYAKSHRNLGWYAETLYYGGRVYSDLGDYPTALRYFQEALEYNADSEDMNLRGNILSQTGRLLHELRLYSEAIPYLEQSIQVSKELKDTFGLAYDNRLLFLTHLNRKDYAEAKRYNSEALRYAGYLKESDAADIAADKASIYLEEGKIDTALSTIRPLPEIVDSISRNYTLAIASEIYLEAGILDTAYMYGRKLAMSTDANNRKTGFRILFSAKMREYICKDTLLSYIPIYKDEIEAYLDQHEAQLALVQHSNYNYQMHVREREKSEIQRSHIMIMLLVALLIVVGLTIVVMSLRIRNAKQEIRLHNYLEIIKNINNGERNVEVNDKVNLKQKILEELEIFEENTLKPDVSPAILESKAYGELKLLVESNKGMNDSHWKSLEEIVENCAPGFKSKLETLTNGNLTKGDYQIALLIRSGFIPTEIKILMNRSKSAISSRRGELAKKIFEAHNQIKNLDKLILGL